MKISQSITNQVKVPGKPTRKSTRLNSPDLISRRNIIDDPKLREVYHEDSNQELDFINKSSNHLEDLKELLECDLLDLYNNEMDSDPLFKIEKIIDHKINDKGHPMLYVQWDKLGEDKSW